MELTLKATMWFRDGSTITYENPIQFEVLGMPPGEDALIGYPTRWKVLHRKNDLHGEWFGDFDSPDAALAAIREWPTGRVLPRGYTPARELIDAIEHRTAEHAGRAHRLAFESVVEFPPEPMPARHVRVTASTARQDGRVERATVGVGVDRLRDPDYIADQLAYAMVCVLDGTLGPGEQQLL